MIILNWIKYWKHENKMRFENMVQMLAGIVNSTIEYPIFIKSLVIMFNTLVCAFLFN